MSNGPSIVARRGKMLQNCPVDLITGDLLMFEKGDNVYIISENTENYYLYTGRATAEVPKQLIEPGEELNIVPKYER